MIHKLFALYRYPLYAWAAVLGIGYRWRYMRWLRRLQPIPALSQRPSSDPLRLCFVVPWYGKSISGGAEAECRAWIEAIREFCPSLVVEVATTTLQEFAAHWNLSVHPEGAHTETGVVVHRFHPTRPIRRIFSWINGFFLTSGDTASLQGKGTSPVCSAVEWYYIHHMIISPGLFHFLSTRYHDFDFFIYMPYLYSTSLLGGRLTGEKSILIPCLHEERYAYMGFVRRLLASVCAVGAHVPAEARLVTRLAQGRAAEVSILGEPMETEVPVGEAQIFRNHYGIQSPFLLYLGRKIEGKNLLALVAYFKKYKEQYPSDLKLVLAGKGDLQFKDAWDVVDLDFLSEPDKQHALAACELLVQPSLLESFSLVLMEAWLQRKPVLVHGDCEVLADHCKGSGGGLCFVNAVTFTQSLQVILTQKDASARMGEAGCRYVKENYDRESVARKFETFVRNLSCKRSIL